MRGGERSANAVTLIGMGKVAVTPIESGSGTSGAGAAPAGGATAGVAAGAAAEGRAGTESTEAPEVRTLLLHRQNSAL